MKKIAVVAALAAVLMLAVSVKPASAWHHGNYFWGGFAAGTATGLLFGAVAAPRYYAPPPVYYYPAPPAYVYPAPVCRDFQTPGYWGQVPVTDPGGLTTYQSMWVPGSVQRVCQ
jgi:hypothetical protein